MSFIVRNAPTRLRARLLGIVLVAAIPVVLAVSYLESSARDREQARTLGANLRIARLAAANEAAQIDGAARLLGALAEFPTLRGADSVECARVLGGVLRTQPQYLNFSVINADGGVFCSAMPLNPSFLVGGSANRWLDRVLRTRTTAVAEVHSAVTGRPAIIIARPMFDARNHIARVVAGTIGVEQLERVISISNIPAGATLTLFDSTGTIILRSHDGDRWIGRRVPDTVALHRLRSGAAEDLSDQLGVDGVRRLYATVPVRSETDAGMFLGLGVDRRIAYAETDRVLRDDILLLLLVGGAGLLAALLAAQTFVLRPIRSLRAVIDRIAGGDLAARATLAEDFGGIGEFADGVNSMASALDTRQQERDDAEHKLRGSEDRYRLLFEQNPNAMWVFDLETTAFLEVNEAAIRRYGYSRDEFLSMRLEDIRPPEDVPLLEVRLAQGHGPLSMSHGWRHRKKSGELIDVEITSHAIHLGGRRAKLVVAYDVSDRTRAETALREAEERMRFALEASRVGVWEVNLRTAVFTWSTTCEMMHGIVPGSFGRSLEAFVACVHPEDRRKTADEIQRAIDAHVDPSYEYRTVWPNGTVRQIRSVGRFFYDEHGAPIRGAGVVLDVTVQRSIEDQLRQAQKMEAVGQLAGGIAHDFNNLLTVITANVQLAMSALPPTGPAREELDDARAAALRAAQLTRQLLAFSRKQTLHTEAVSIDEMTEQLAPMLRRLIGEDIAIECELSKINPIVVADRAQLEQVLINLSVNARDAMPKGGTLRLQTSVVRIDRDDIVRDRLDLEPGAYVALRVRDTGTGMTPEVLVHAFEPFFTTKEVGKGTGLGLPSVYGTVKQSGGHVSVESSVGVGTTFTIYLPLQDALVEARIVTPLSTAVIDPSQATILLVEDDDGVRSIAARVLRGAGFDVLVAANGPAAIATATRYNGEIMLVLSDVVMPGMSGLEMVALLESDRPGIGVLLMSGYPEAEIRRRGMLTQRFPILEKPFTREGLLARVQQALVTREGLARVA